MAGALPNDATTLHVIDVSGVAFVSGLQWRPLRSPRSYMAEAKAIGKKEHMEMVTIRKTRTVIQAGFAPKGRSRLKGLYSLAAACAGVLGENWIGVFAVDAERYALIAVHRGAVVPGYDVIGLRATIEPALRQIYSLLSGENSEFENGGRVIAPAEFAFSGDQIALSDLLTAKTLKSDYRLRPLTFGLTTREFVMIGTGVAALAAAGYGANWWLAMQAAEKAAAADRAKAAAAQDAALAAKANIVLPWVSAPSAGELLAGCAALLHDTPLALGGWHVASVRCANGTSTAEYRRLDAAPVAAFVAAAEARYGNAPALLDQGTKGTITTAITLPVATDDKLRATDALVLDLTNLIQRVEGAATLTLVNKPYAPNPTTPDVPAPTWTTHGFTVQTTFPPERLFDGFDKSGVRVAEIVTTLNPSDASLSWTITGEFYAR